MRATRILLIETARNNSKTFAPSLQRKYDIVIAHSGNEGLKLAAKRAPDVVVLDAASLRTSGNRICARLRSALDDTPIIHIRDKEISDAPSDADILLHPPFTARKLINRIERFATSTTAHNEILENGRFSLNLAQNVLITPATEKRLTPKLIALMEMFMRTPNTVLERKDIMQTVWKTDYMGDTRTLDVHIRWLRQVVEPNPRKPVFIKTVRGVGYIFAGEAEPLPQENDGQPSAESTTTNNGAAAESKPEPAPKKTPRADGQKPKTTPTPKVTAASGKVAASSVTTEKST